MKKWLAFAALLALASLFALPAQAAQKQTDTAVLAEKYVKHEHFIVIDKSLNKLFYYQEGELIDTFAVATGKKPSYTPEGLFVIHEKIKNRPYYKEKIKGGDPKNPLGDRWLGLEVTVNGKTSYAYGIHGTNNEKSIGKYVSAGCIRMYNKDVRWLFEQVEDDTPVLIRK
ncbi:MULTISPECIES: L,D-transpeptidase [Cohnella]|uniref:L,D-transpeptidase n=1 Tax=Cohnella TaxID=329857 RepID=UPI0009BC1DA8|nr:L,D-transpeptidase [Cohnella massiliensis]MBN2981889.1 L,D-transpeptidase [Cohnella algarum]